MSLTSIVIVFPSREAIKVGPLTKLFSRSFSSRQRAADVTDTSPRPAVARRQGDQIGRIFAQWAIVNFEQFL
jgi:hypothetical protein